MRSKAFMLTVVVLALACLAAADVKYTLNIQAAAGAPPMSHTVYVKGPNERRDMNMMGMGDISTVTQCTERRILTVNHKCKVYFAAPMDETGAPVLAPAGGQARKGGVIKVENEIRDTGERQKIAGYDARHIIVKTRMEAGPGACAQGGGQVENDFWIANIPMAQAACTPKVGENPQQFTPGECRDRVQLTSKGDAGALNGVPVKGTMTMVAPDGKRHSMTMEVSNISTTALDVSLFQAPADYRQVNSMQEVYTCGMGMGNVAEMMRNAQRQAAQAQAESESRRSETTPAASTPGEAAGSGLFRIGVVLSDRTNRVDAAGMANKLVEDIKQIDGFDAVIIEGRTPDAIQKEATEKHCTLVFYGDVTEAKTAAPKLGGLLGRAAGIGGGSPLPRHNMRMDYRLATVDPFDEQVARDTLNHSEQVQSLDDATGKFMESTAQRATTDAARWQRQKK